MTRTYTTEFFVEAESSEEAVKKVEAMGDEKYTEEMKQCNAEETLEVEE